jgi:hypothetical protein
MRGGLGLVCTGCVAAADLSGEAGTEPDDPQTLAGLDLPDRDGDGWPDGLDARVCGDGREDYVEIQEAIEASAPGDLIGVCPGSYGPIEVLWGFDVKVLSSSGPEQTTIDGGSGTAVFVKDGVLDLRGFRLTGTGYPEEWATDMGGALTVEEGEVTVSDCIVSGVTGPFALVFDENQLVMQDVVWEDNETHYLWFLYQGEQATFLRNVVRGGVHESVLVTEEVDALSLSHSLFSGVTIDRAMSAFRFGGEAHRVYNNVFHEIDDLEPWGGRVFAGEPDFRNNLVLGCDAWQLEPMPSRYSLFWGNEIDYGPYLEGPGNLFEDPEIDPEFGLLPGSPAIDAGDPAEAFLDPDGSRNDMGMYGGR